MTVLDAYALVAALAGEAARDDVEDLMAEGATPITAVNLAEVVDVMVRRKGRTAAEVSDRLDLLGRWEALQVVPVDRALAARAGTLRASHYHRSRRPVSVADCVAAATAEGLGEALATSDPHLAAMARDEGVEVVPLPDSRGRRPKSQ